MPPPAPATPPAGPSCTSPGKYAAADGNTAADFDALVRRRGPDLLVPHETFRPPPGSTDPAFTDAPHGPKDAA